ncbi:MAG: type II toxin-antitoxin system RelE/ParE family toxin [Planctomycetota bacterium]
MQRVRVTESAKQDIRENLVWWGENRSEEQAERWYLGVYAEIASLASTALQRQLASEAALREAGYRQASFGLGRHPTHRIVFGVEGDEVVVYRVRALKQDSIDLEALGDD